MYIAVEPRREAVRGRNRKRETWRWPGLDSPSFLCTNRCRLRVDGTTVRRTDQWDDLLLRPGMARHQHTLSASGPLTITDGLSPIQRAYLDLVDTYGDVSDYNLLASKIPERTRSSSSSSSSSSSVPAPRARSPSSEEEQTALDRLKRLVRDPESSAEDVFEAYRALPAPRISLLSRPTIRRLLRGLSAVERKSVPSMMRYLSAVDDVQTAGIPLTVSEWNSAISHVGRCFPRVSPTEVQSALHIFRSIEASTAVQADRITFNALFDVAVKAGKYSLAQLILEEMRGRKIDLDRFSHAGLIFYYGLKGDGDGIRAAYRRLVYDGQIVDTMLLNCVIASLIRAGEIQTAEHVYERMKEFHASQVNAPLYPTYWRKQRSLAKVLQRAAQVSRGQLPRQRKEQEKAPLAPNMKTYQHLLRHHCLKTGELDTIIRLLDEMPTYHQPLHGSIFLILFQGFTTHGVVDSGVRRRRPASTDTTNDQWDDAWTAHQLNDVWSAYRSAVDSRLDGLELKRSIIVWALRAYHRCTNTDRMLKAWEDVRDRWHTTADEQVMVIKAIQQMIDGDGQGGSQQHRQSEDRRWAVSYMHKPSSR